MRFQSSPTDRRRRLLVLVWVAARRAFRPLTPIRRLPTSLRRLYPPPPERHCRQHPSPHAWIQRPVGRLRTVPQRRRNATPGPHSLHMRKTDWPKYKWMPVGRAWHGRIRLFRQKNEPGLKVLLRKVNAILSTEIWG